MILSVIVIVLLWRLDFFDPAVITNGTSNLFIFMGDTVPPDLSVISVVSKAILETLQISFAGTLLGFFIAIPFALLGARNLSPIPVLLISRLIVAVFRTVPSLLWALLFVIIVGLGPLAGTLGIAAYTIGYLAKLYYEFFESVDPEITEAVKATGASKLHLARFVIWPETANNILSQLMFMFEYNIRASSILGFVGAGGIGFYIQSYLNTLNYQRLSTLLILVLILVLMMDFISAWVRRKYLLAN